MGAHRKFMGPFWTYKTPWKYPGYMHHVKTTVILGQDHAKIACLKPAEFLNAQPKVGNCTSWELTLVLRRYHVHFEQFVSTSRTRSLTRALPARWTIVCARFVVKIVHNIEIKLKEAKVWNNFKAIIFQTKTIVKSRLECVSKSLFWELLVLQGKNQNVQPSA